VYLNGAVYAGPASATNAPYNSTAKLNIGGTKFYTLDCWGGGTGWVGEEFNGLIDEVRVSNIARSADWIATEYNNQYTPSAFYSFGSEESPEQGAVIGTEIRNAEINNAWIQF